MRLADHEKSCPATPTRDNHERQGATTFTLFPKLPTELRLRVWSFVTLGPQRITIRSARHGSFMYHFKTGPKPPAVLQVSQEARQYMQKGYDIITTNGSQPRYYYQSEQNFFSFADMGGRDFDLKTLDGRNAAHLVQFSTVDARQIKEALVRRNTHETWSSNPAEFAIMTVLFMRDFCDLKSLKILYIAHADEHWDDAFAAIFTNASIMLRYEANVGGLASDWDFFIGRKMNFGNMPEIRHVKETELDSMCSKGCFRCTKESRRRHRL